MFSSRRAGRATFWYLAADRLVAAVIARTSDEPLLEACAASYAQAGQPSLFAPGVVELAWLLGADRFGHVAALASPYCSLDPDDDGDADTGAASLVADGADCFAASGADRHGAAATALAGADERIAAVRGGSGRRVRAQLRAVSQAQALFRRARLRLLALDCEACALVTLAETLGTSAAGSGPAFGQGSSRAVACAGDDSLRQPLAAVSVSPEAERAAHALGDDLAVPVGLALAWFGAARAR